jgi:hypothetical protein
MTQEKLIQLAFSGLNVANTALAGLQKLRAAEATGDSATIEAARQEAADEANAVADALREG